MRMYWQKQCKPGDNIVKSLMCWREKITKPETISLKYSIQKKYLTEMKAK